MEAPALDWSGAEVSDGVLIVAIDGDRPKGFKPAFDRTVTLLGGGPAGAVSVKSGKVRVRDVREGSEETLHHFLESVLLEVSAALGAHSDPDVDDGEPDDGDGQSDAADDADARMTDRFRGLRAD